MLESQRKWISSILPLRRDEREKSNSISTSTEAADVEKNVQTVSPGSIDGNKDETINWDVSPDNPLNWSKWKRMYMIAAVAAISLAASLGSSIYTPAIDLIQRDFGVSTTVAILPFSLYVLALGFGPVIAAPLSENYGRHIVYIVSPVVGALFTVGAGASNNIASLSICRFFAGFFFSPALAIGSGTINDVMEPRYRAIPASLYIMMPFLGPGFGPVIGAFVTVRKSWRWTQWTLIFFALFSWILLLFMSETYKKAIISRLSQQRNKTPSAPNPKPSAFTQAKALLTITLFRPLHMLLTEPIVASLSLYVAFNFGVLFSFFAAFPYVFTKTHHFDTEQNGLVFISIIVGCLLATGTSIAIDKFMYQKKFKEAAEKGEAVRVEWRLVGAMLGSLGLPVGLFWFAWTARAGVSWASPVVAAVPFAWGNLTVFIAAALYLMDCYQALNGASAMAANGLLRYTLGAVFPLFTLQMYRRLGIAWATSLLGFISIAMLPVTWIIFRYGRGLRERSSYIKKS